MIEKSYALASGTLATQQVGHSKKIATTVVFIHGWLDNSASFSSVISNLKVLSPNSHLVAIDLFGHGFSSHKSGSYYPFHDYIDDLHQLVTKLSPNRLVLVGHSLGALIASCYSAAFPENVSGLIQIEGREPLSEVPHATVSRLRSGVLIVEQGITESEHSWQWRCDSNLRCDSLYRMSQAHAEAIMAAIECPQLIILGTNGLRNLQHNRYKLANSTLNIESIPGGHYCHLESPELVSELIFGVVNKI
jgi:pimeloyl-ACP methyl ester carboxylesterase